MKIKFLGESLINKEIIDEGDTSTLILEDTNGRYVRWIIAKADESDFVTFTKATGASIEANHQVCEWDDFPHILKILEG